MFSILLIGTLNCAVAAALLAVGLLLPSLAAAQTQQQLDWCVNRSRTYSTDQQIAGCTAAIDSGRQSRQNMAISYANHARAYRIKGDLDRAIADFNQAIQLDPKSSDAFNNRGFAYKMKGDLDRAIVDFNDANDPERTPVDINFINLYFKRR